MNRYEIELYPLTFSINANSEEEAEEKLYTSCVPFVFTQENVEIKSINKEQPKRESEVERGS
tara:strand:+ start:472 stop:657 length:186 start_codon:yes stop_codon:yes gene_type:complete